MLGVRGWSFCMLTDLKFEENGVREYSTDKKKWTVIIQGRVGIAIDAEWTNSWREGGAKVYHPGRATAKNTRLLL